MKLTYVFISHNLADVKSMCDSLAVMYLGKIMETGESDKIFARPLHPPYTQALLDAVLDINFRRDREQAILEGDIPSPINPPRGCRFWQRCPPKAMVGCETVPPVLCEVEEGHSVACHFVNGFPPAGGNYRKITQNPSPKTRRNMIKEAPRACGASLFIQLPVLFIRVGLADIFQDMRVAELPLVNKVYFSYDVQAFHRYRH